MRRGRRTPLHELRRAKARWAHVCPTACSPCGGPRVASGRLLVASTCPAELSPGARGVAAARLPPRRPRRGVASPAARTPPPARRGRPTPPPLPGRPRLGQRVAQRRTRLGHLQPGQDYLRAATASRPPAPDSGRGAREDPQSAADHPPRTRPPPAQVLEGRPRPRSRRPVRQGPRSAASATAPTPDGCLQGRVGSSRSVIGQRVSCDVFGERQLGQAGRRSARIGPGIVGVDPVQGLRGDRGGSPRSSCASAVNAAE